MLVNIVYTTTGYAEVELEDGMCAVTYYPAPPHVNVDVIDETGEGTFDFDLPVGASVSEVREASEDEMSYDDCQRVVFAAATAAATVS